MRKFIVTTTISKPSKALYKFLEKKDWDIIIVGDLKTPHSEYESLPCLYMHPDYQNQKYADLSDKIGWNKIQRRTLGFMEAFGLGADIIATVDDDNIPYDDWGQNIHVGKEIEVDCYDPVNEVFDPLSVTNYNNLWHRGYPLSLVKTKNDVTYLGKIKRKVLVQADLWDGDPDIDAVERIAWSPLVKFNVNAPYCSNKISPFNSQNTFIAREVIPFYLALPFVGRMDDIWPSYIIQQFFPNSVIYNKATVYQERNPQNLITNLKNEVLGYETTLSLLRDLKNWMTYLPETAQLVYKSYLEWSWKKSV